MTAEHPVADTDISRVVDEAFAYLARSIAARPQTEAELAAKLRRRDVPDDVAADALARAKSAGMVDDVAFAKLWVADRGHGRGFGAARLRRELERRQVPGPVVDDALADLDDRDDLAAATELARVRGRQLPAALAPEQVARRLQGYLVRRGHPPGLARRVAVDVSGLDTQWD